jgi:hypothetical protein
MVDAAGGNAPDFESLANYLKGELDRIEADERAIHLRSRADFFAFANAALETLAHTLGISLGFLAGEITALYEATTKSFGEGWRRGFERGRGAQR